MYSKGLKSKAAFTKIEINNEWIVNFFKIDS